MMMMMMIIIIKVQSRGFSDWRAAVTLSLLVSLHSA